MRVDTALLCDAATVREGLLHVLGGGITRANRPGFPAPLGMTLALRVMIHPTETADAHAMQILLLDADGNRGADIQITFGVSEAAQLVAGEEASLPIAIPLTNAALPQAGTYSFEVLIDGIHQVSVPFRAELVGAPSQPENDERDNQEES